MDSKKPTSEKETNMATTTKVTCSKCSGTGRLACFSHVAAGVCFACDGAGFVMVDIEARKVEFSPEFVAKCEAILNANETTFAHLSYARLLKARDFAHNYVMAPGANEVFPEVHRAWEQYGEPHFQAAQSQELAKRGC
jgi:RecJ-like exonuclease